MSLRIAVDWGTSALRLWALDEQGRVIAERRSDQGMGQLAPDQFESAFLALAGDLLDAEETVDVLICGMAGARSGWREAPYLPVPDCPPSGAGAMSVQTEAPRLNVRILPGMSQAEPADVMRGEETQIAGYLADHPGFSGALCLPGTHTKWVQIEAGRITGFRTVMTGEIFALLSTSSVLRLSMTGDDPWDETSFVAGVRHALDHPEDLTAALFALRAEGLLAPVAEGHARARLSGLLIGQELAATRGYWRAGPVAIIGASTLATRYQSALKTLEVSATIDDGDACVLKGLDAGFQYLKEQGQ